MQHTRLSMTTDTLRYRVADLDKWVRNVRRLNRIQADPRQSAQNYVEALRDVYELQVEARRHGAFGPLVDNLAPIPFREDRHWQEKGLAWKPF